MSLRDAKEVVLAALDQHAQGQSAAAIIRADRAAVIAEAKRVVAEWLKNTALDGTDTPPALAEALDAILKEEE